MGPGEMGQIHTLIQQVFIELLLCVSTELSCRHTALNKKGKILTTMELKL